MRMIHLLNNGVVDNEIVGCLDDLQARGGESEGPTSTVWRILIATEDKMRQYLSPRPVIC